MPEHTEGHVSVPSCVHTEQPFPDAAMVAETLARLEAKIDRLAEQIADAEAEAEEIMRRAVAPGPPSRVPRRRLAPVLRVVPDPVNQG